MREYDIPINARRGDIWYIANENNNGSVQTRTRPGIIVSNDINNAHSSVLNVVYLTNAEKKPLPTHVKIGESTALCEQIDSISVNQLLNFKRQCTEKEMLKINTAMMVQLGIIG